jgi:oxalate decarboxylase
MLETSRRTLLAGAMVLGATSVASAQDKTQPIVGKKGGTILGPRDPTREGENPDFLRPPVTDHGSIPNLRYAFSDTHMKMREGGWSREITVRELPAATTIAGVNMRPTPGGVRELHWHKEAEWSFMLAGKARITAVDNDGHNFVADVESGDLWYFPSGIPHSIQGLSPDGCEFILAFPNGAFFGGTTLSRSLICSHICPKRHLRRTLGSM